MCSYDCLLRYKLLHNLKALSTWPKGQKRKSKRKDRAILLIPRYSQRAH